MICIDRLLYCIDHKIQVFRVSGSKTRSWIIQVDIHEYPFVGYIKGRLAVSKSTTGDPIPDDAVINTNLVDVVKSTYNVNAVNFFRNQHIYSDELYECLDDAVRAYKSLIDINIITKEF